MEPLIRAHLFPLYTITSLFVMFINYFTVLPQIVAQALISFHRFFILTTKQDRHLLVHDDSCAVYTVQVIHNLNGTRVSHTSCLYGGVVL